MRNFNLQLLVFHAGCCSFCRRSSTARPRHSNSDGTTLAACASTYHNTNYVGPTLMNAVVYGRGPQSWCTWWCHHNLPAGLIYVQLKRRIQYTAQLLAGWHSTALHHLQLRQTSQETPISSCLCVRAWWPIGLTLSDVLLLIDVCDKVPWYN